jgi:outer membrane autotransporter protein
MILSLGVGNYDFKARVKSVNSGYTLSDRKDFSSVGFRYGVGIEYQINDSLRVRGLARFVDTDDEYIKSITEFSLGLRYLF